MATLRLDHAARVGQPLLVLVGVHEIQQVGFAGELDQIRMGDGQGLAPVDERVVRGEEIDDVSAFLVSHGVEFGDLVRTLAPCSLTTLS